ncbi:MAG: hypothetical protein LBI53_07895 [Candidatus Peribacteria bacterium]|nr:hypothetical protein [Candidatus Peribacteria bacterium]
MGYAPQWINEENQVLIATIPFGYAEGFPRCLREKLSYRWKKRKSAQVGSICMNLSMCKGDANMKIGDKIVLIEQDKDSPLSVQHISAQAEMIPYEFLVGLDKGIRREVV